VSLRGRAIDARAFGLSERVEILIEALEIKRMGFGCDRADRPVGIVGNDVILIQSSSDDAGSGLRLNRLRDGRRTTCDDGTDLISERVVVNINSSMLNLIDDPVSGFSEAFKRVGKPDHQA
jgi:hypothetical protein